MSMGPHPARKLWSPPIRAATSFPAISGDLVVWQDDRDGDWNIYLENLTTHQETQITSDPSDQQYPAISGNRIIWSDSPSTPNPKIFINGTAPGREYSLTPGLLTGNPNEPPALAGETAVWAQGIPVRTAFTATIRSPDIRTLSTRFPGVIRPIRESAWTR